MLQRHSTFWSVIVFLVGVFVPIVGHILDTILILRDGHSWPGKALWLVVVWLFPFVGALLYMLFGRRHRQVTMIHPASPHLQSPSAPIFPKTF
jgi:uncharacterized BrkB/YihY/UPF0761 family membrane protein